MFLAHASLSFLVNEAIQKKRITPLTLNEKIFVGVFALLSGILPDIDILILQGFGLPTFIHHMIISHTIPFYIGLWIVLKLLFALIYRIFSKNTVKFLNKEFLDILLNTFLISTVMHILADFLVGNIMILYPFSNSTYSILGQLLEPNLFASYFLGISFGLEIVICGIFVIYMVKSIFKKTLGAKIFKIILISLCGIFLLANGFAYFNVYRSSILKDTNGRQNYDLDQDLVIDNQDIDVDNDGTDNLLDVDIKELVKQVNDITASSKWTAYADNAIWASYKTNYGGLTSYRLIAQAYFNLHSPITPVLRNQAVSDGTLANYADALNGLESLHNYFKDKDLLSQLTSEETILSNGTLFFISDTEGKVLNVGMVTGNDTVGIVLPYDQRVKTHTFSDVTNYYGNNVKVDFTK